MPKLKKAKEDLRIIEFHKGQFEYVIAGEKLFTIRRLRPETHILLKGEYFVGRFQEGFDLLLIATQNTESKIFANLTKEDAMEDLYATLEELQGDLRRFYPNIQCSDMVAMIRFEIPKMTDIPTIAFNKYSAQ